MADTTGISWCDHTYNAWIGCTKVSEGCKLCYAERDNERYHWTDEWGPQGMRHRTKSHHLFRWNKERWMECEACGWRGKPETSPECPACKKPALRPTRQRVFVNSLSDLFEDRQELPPWRNEFWAMAQVCDQIDFLILTKRPENIRRFTPAAWNENGWPSNVWLGVSVENQPRAEDRIPLLLQVRAAVRWISVEPLLGPVRLDGIAVKTGTGGAYALYPLTGETWEGMGTESDYGPKIDWIVVGGESGPGCRPMDPAWPRALRDQCAPLLISFYMKQMGGWPDRRETMADLPRDLRIREWPDAIAPQYAYARQLIFQVPSS